VIIQYKSIFVVSLLVLCGLFLVTSTRINANTTISGKLVTADKEGPKITSVVKHSLGEGIKAKRFYAGVVDDKNEKWFLTDAGIISGTLFNKLTENSRIPLKDLNNLAFESTGEGSGVWISTPQGAILASLPINSSSKVTNYDISNSSILSNNVLSVIAGKNKLLWFATDKGISALYDTKWLSSKEQFETYYSEDMFRDYPIKALATSINGDTLYAATEGVGITRVYRNNVDAVTGASQYAQWGPIEMPSDSVYSICITPDGTQWIGTSQGVGRHVGFVTLTNWTAFSTKNGLVNNFVQAIAADPLGNIWCGTKGGVSVYDGVSWTSFTMKDGLISNDILFIISDKNGVIFLGTDNGIMVYSNGQLSCYQ
jgi:ligand-binding sensor domain-containing protein